ncbi:monophenol monooxygenase [Fusarium acutatum]|uniref:Monophenol monooxygenase n=1 Tax=Fusarium acutatum TaxID=78861 RepID=A0A8H4JDQ9_9HYPO|nr:monophenol monooxygenase [Fusarium acutatum]
MASDDQQSYLKAVKCLMQLPAQTGIEGTVTGFDDMNAMHQAQFLPFHRLYIRVYEQLLRDECGYKGPTPWWDETRDAGNFMDSPLLDPDTGFGGNRTGPDNCVTDGPFANTALHIVNQINSTLGNETYVQECHDKSTYIDFWEATGFTTHGAGHSGVGGVMEDIDASPGDPLFYIHHGFIDRLWWKWQSEDLDSRLYQRGGPSAQGGTEELTLDYVMTTYGIRPNVTVKEVMDIQGGFLCYKYDY